MKRKILLSSVVASLLLFSGCTTAEDDSNTTTASANTTTGSTSGTVADGAIDGAKIYIDVNENGKLDEGEPSSITDENGNFTLDTNLTSGILVAEGGKDIERGVNFTSKFIIPLSDNVNLTPLTTMAYFYSKKNNTTYNDAISTLSEKLGVSTSDFISNPEKNNNIKGMSVQLESSLELLMETNSSLSSENLYTQFAENIANYQNNGSDINISEIVTENIPTNELTKQTTIIGVDKVNDMVTNNDFSNYQKTNDVLLNVISDEKTFDNTTDLSNYIENSVENFSSIGIVQSNLRNIDTNISDVNQTANLKTADVNNAKNTISEIKDITYEILDPSNNDLSDNNTTNIVGNIITNYNNALKPAIDEINTTINNENTIIDNSTKEFDKKVNSDFNYSLSKISDRLNAIGDILNKYDYNQTIDNNKTSFGDILSHTYEEKDGKIISIYSLNDTNLTITENNVSDPELSDITTNGEIILKDENYTVKVTNLSYKDNILTLTTNSEINGIDNSTLNGDINFSLNINQDEFKTGKTIQSLSNVDIEAKAIINTSDNKEFNGLIILKDTSLELDGLLKDNTRKLTLDGKIKVYADNTDWKQYEDDIHNDDSMFDSLSFVNDDLATKYVLNWPDDINQDIDVNITTSNGSFYECSMNGSEWDNNLSIDCGSDNPTKTYQMNQLENKVISFKIDDRNLTVNYIEYEWIDNNNSELEFGLMINSGVYNTDYLNNSYVFKNDNTILDTNMSISEEDMTLSEPIKATDLLGSVKVDANVTDETNNVNAQLNLNINDNGKNKTYTITNLNLTTPSLNIKANQIESVQDENNTNISLTLEDINATVTDTNGNDAKLTDIYYTGDKDALNMEYYGKISYMDTTFIGYIYRKGSQDIYSAKYYAEIQKTNYQPFNVSILNSSNEIANESNSSILLTKGDYSIAGYADKNNSEENINLFDNNGVFTNIKYLDGDFDSFELEDKNGTNLGKITNSNNWEIIYSDNTTETLY